MVFANSGEGTIDVVSVRGTQGMGFVEGDRRHLSKCVVSSILLSLCLAESGMVEVKMLISNQGLK